MSAWDGVWWATTTVTTVGYGDIVPQTNGGRVIAIVVMVVGTTELIDRLSLPLYRHHILAAVVAGPTRRRSTLHEGSWSHDLYR